MWSVAPVCVPASSAASSTLELAVSDPSVPTTIEVNMRTNLSRPATAPTVRVLQRAPGTPGRRSDAVGNTGVIALVRESWRDAPNPMLAPPSAVNGSSRRC